MKICEKERAYNFQVWENDSYSVDIREMSWSKYELLNSAMILAKAHSLKLIGNVIEGYNDI